MIIAEQGRGHEDEVEEVIHEIAPLGDAGVAVAAQRPVEAIREPLEGQHERRQPKPMTTPAGEVAEGDEPGAPQDCRQRQMVTLDASREPRPEPVDQSFLRLRQRRP